MGVVVTMWVVATVVVVVAASGVVLIVVVVAGFVVAVVAAVLLVVAQAGGGDAGGPNSSTTLGAATALDWARDASKYACTYVNGWSREAPTYVPHTSTYGGGVLEAARYSHPRACTHTMR